MNPIIKNEIVVNRPKNDEVKSKIVASRPHSAKVNHPQPIVAKPNIIEKYNVYYGNNLDKLHPNMADPRIKKNNQSPRNNSPNRDKNVQNFNLNYNNVLNPNKNNNYPLQQNNPVKVLSNNNKKVVIEKVNYNDIKVVKKPNYHYAYNSKNDSPLVNKANYAVLNRGNIAGPKIIVIKDKK